MTCRNPNCLGHYDFDKIAHFAQKRFVEGCPTVTLLAQARSQTEKEEIALVSLLDLEDDQIRGLEIACPHAGQCKVLDCKDRLKEMLQERLAGDLPGKNRC